MNTTLNRRFCWPVLAALVLLAAPGHAQTLAELALYEGSDRMARLIAGCQEGRLIAVLHDNSGRVSAADHG